MKKCAVHNSREEIVEQNWSNQQMPEDAYRTKAGMVLCSHPQPAMCNIVMQGALSLDIWKLSRSGQCSSCPSAFGWLTGMLEQMDHGPNPSASLCVLSIDACNWQEVYRCQIGQTWCMFIYLVSTPFFIRYDLRVISKHEHDDYY